MNHFVDRVLSDVESEADEQVRFALVDALDDPRSQAPLSEGPPPDSDEVAYWRTRALAFEKLFRSSTT